MLPTVYLDHHSTTPCDPRVMEVMLPYFSILYGNPANNAHAQGRMAAEAVEEARGQVAQLLGASPREICFTGGATESNNLALFGSARYARQAVGSNRNRIVTTPIEHAAILNPCLALAREGFEVCFLAVTPAGSVDLQSAGELINERTLLVSVQVANQEVGTIQPVADLAALAHGQGALMHCDAAQAVGKIPLDVEAFGIDLLSMSAHKLYGPKGIGALYLRGGAQAHRLTPLTWGGAQEDGLRPGTLNVPAIVGFGEACRICTLNLDQEMKQITALRDHFEALLDAGIPGLGHNGDTARRLPGNSSLRFPGVDSEAVLAHLPEVALSTGSACRAGAIEPSPVLLSLGLTPEQAHSTVRVGLGRFNTESEITLVAQRLVDTFHVITSL